MYAIVLAGGVGTRLWPCSRNDSPKQLIKLIAENTMLQATVARLQSFMPVENIVVVTGENHASQVHQQLPELPAANVLVEPAGRGTAPAIGLGLLHIRRQARLLGDLDPIIGSFHADHVITKVDHFQAVVSAASQVAGQGFIVTLGITPDAPHTGYGYIERAEVLEEVNNLPVYRVARFVEKPPRATAEQYLATGHYSWNSGMFIWKLSTIMQEYQAHLGQLVAQLEEIDRAHGQPTQAQTLLKVWGEVRSETIDVGIAEKSQRMAVLPADIGWSDVGDWAAVAELLAASSGDGAGNAVIGQHLGLDSKNTLIYSTNQDKLVATIGLEDLVIVDTGDVLLVARRSLNQDVKKIVERLRQAGLEKYL